MNTKAGEVLLEIRSLTVPLPDGGDREFAVRDVSMELRAGEILCVVGESGSGKSVSANAVMGLLPRSLTPQSGSIMFGDDDLLRASEQELLAIRGKHIGMIFQEPMSALNPLMTVGAQIEEVLAVHDAYPGAARNARVLELLEFVGLPDPAALQQAYPFRLSGGQRQRVMIAIALALEPQILIADEPTTALDVTTQAQILALIKKIQRSKGTAVLFITHDFGVVADIANRVAVMEKGLVVEQGLAADILERPQHPYTRKLIAAVPRGHTKEGSVADSGEPLLQVRNLSKTYVTARGLFARKRVVHAVDDVSFSLRAGETLGVVGESGSGKSTIGKCLLKLIDIDGGEMLFKGQDIAPLSAARFRPMRHQIQVIFQDPFSSLNPRHTVGRIITDGLRANGVGYQDAAKRARELLNLMQLEVSSFDRYPNEFSGGQRQRIGIARALALNPELLVADESVSALDVSVQAQVLALLHSMQQRLNLAMIFITHDLRVAASMCHRIAVMHRGRIVEYGTAAQILESPQHEYTQRLIAAVPGRRWLTQGAVPQGAPDQRPSMVFSPTEARHHGA